MYVLRRYWSVDWRLAMKLPRGWLGDLGAGSGSQNVRGQTYLSPRFLLGLRLSPRYYAVVDSTHRVR